MKNKVLVIIVTYNGKKWIDRCLGSLKESTVPVDVFVVDNGSKDDTVARVRETGRKWFSETSNDGSGWWLVDMVESKENLGFGRANNLGLKYAMDNGYEFVYLLNQDAWVESDTIELLLEAFRKNPGYGVLSPVQMTAAGDKMDPQFKLKCQKYLPDLKSIFPSMKAVHPVPFVMAAHWMISRECLEKVGGFSPAFAHYGEDDNFLDRCRWHGMGIGVDIEAKAVHDRENRPTPKAKKMRLKYVGSLVKISNPACFLPWRLLRQPLELLFISIFYLSWDSFVGIFRLIFSYPKLIRWRKASRKGAAFLEMDSRG